MAPLALPVELRYYIVRQGNAMIPLVPVDQLHTDIELEGIPRQLMQHQISGEGWKPTCVTNHPATSLRIKNTSPGNSHRQLPHIEVRLPPRPEVNTRYLAPDHIVRSEAGTDLHASQQASRCTDRSTTAGRSSGQPSTSHTAMSEHAASSAVTPASTYVQESLRFGHCSPNPSGLVPDHSKKVYCTHWMRTGSCDFAQVGCKYKHEMPSRVKLQELGIRQTPLWWKEKQAIRAPTWMEERRAATGIAENVLTPPRAHDRLSWIDRLSISRGAQSNNDGPVPASEQLQLTNEAGISTSTITTPAQPQDTTCTMGAAFIDDLIDLNDDADDSTCSEAAMSASSGDTEASSSTSSTSFSTPQHITNDATDTNILSERPVEGDDRQIPSPKLMAPGKPGQGHEKNTAPGKLSRNNRGAAPGSTRPYHKPHTNNGLAASQHASARSESPQSFQAHRKPSASNSVQPAGTEVQAVIKRTRPSRRQVRAAIKSVKKDEDCGGSK